MRKSTKGTDEAKKHGHVDNKFHTVEVPGFSTSFYIKGEEIKTLTTALKEQGKEADKTEIAALAREWFEDMMKTKKRQVSKRVKNLSQ